ncbi:capsid maturation protease [Serratia phage BF]|uniref:Capsid maturation protease n=1 Tax=Serratia phage BF TaxID=1962671 RepID=A0A1S6UAA1_9CAUD|nr:capsid maturation protease [Serratia phage BF]AQW88641.1 capsid maturation protease [Serratia phage BF]
MYPRFIKEEYMEIYLSGIVLKLNEPNHNGRIYSQKEVSKNISNLQTDILSGSLLSEIDPLERTTTINLDNVGGLVARLEIVNDNLESTVQILPTVRGQQLIRMLEGNGEVFLSSRGTGQIDSDGNVTNYELITVDILPFHLCDDPDKICKVIVK